MKLELASFPVTNVRLNKQTSYKNGLLEVDERGLEASILGDKRIASADLDVAFPNQHTRIINVVDVVEPRVKVSGPGCVFPGILCPPETVGKGRTHRLSGVTVMSSVEYQQTILTGTGAASFTLVDMRGPGVMITPFGSTINIVLTLKLVDGITEQDAHRAIQLAQLQVAQQLAEATRNETPENVEVFELFESDPSLPRVIYVLSNLSIVNDPRPSMLFYGLPLGASLPTFIHPNELLNGVLTPDACHGSAGQCPQTWGWLNCPVVLALLREHGKRLNFLGVILQRTRFLTEHGKHVTAETTSQMARLLKADGVIITNSSGSGNNCMDVMFTLQACESKGIKTVLLTPEWGSTESDVPLPFYVQEATAMVSTGGYVREVKLPAPDKVIGAGDSRATRLFTGDEPFSAWDELTGAWRFLTSGVDWLGVMHNTFKEY